MGRRLRSFCVRGAAAARACSRRAGRCVRIEAWRSPGTGRPASACAAADAVVVADPYPVGRRSDGRGASPATSSRSATRTTTSCRGPRASSSRDGHTLLPSSLDDAFVLDGPGEYEVKEVLLTGVRTYRDDAKGAEAGKQVSFVVELDGMHTIHLGDIGHLLTEEKLGDIGTVDIACVPLGGTLSPDPRRGARRAARPADRRADAALRRRGRMRRGARQVLPRDGRRADSAAQALDRDVERCRPRPRPCSWSRAASRSERRPPAHGARPGHAVPPGERRPPVRCGRGRPGPA